MGHELEKEKSNLQEGFEVECIVPKWTLFTPKWILGKTLIQRTISK